jgi:hypothetical protein
MHAAGAIRMHAAGAIRMKVIGAGFGRTGTTSLKAALEALGFAPCYHMQEVFRRPRHTETWMAAAAGRRVDWKRFLEGYAATVDWPGCTFYRELLEAFPDAKVLLSVRDPETWYESCSQTIYRIGRAFPVAWTGGLVPVLGRVLRLSETVIWKGTFHDRFRDQAHAIAVFRRHIEEVTRGVPPDRLLVYAVSEGWEPLCRFLEVPVPQRPFPRLNDTRQFRRYILAAQGAGALAGLLPLLAGLTLGWSLVRKFR